jgi:hypothetical protein
LRAFYASFAALRDGAAGFAASLVKVGVTARDDINRDASDRSPEGMVLFAWDSIFSASRC